jgi:hypothetical protein
MGPSQSAAARARFEENVTDLEEKGRTMPGVYNLSRGLRCLTDAIEEMDARLTQLEQRIDLALQRFDAEARR